MKKISIALFLTALSFGCFAGDPEPTINLGFNQLWLKNGVPASTEIVAGTMYVGDIVRDTQTGDEYQVLALQKNPNVYGEFDNLTYQVIITDKNIQNYLPTK